MKEISGSIVATENANLDNFKNFLLEGLALSVCMESIIAIAATDADLENRGMANPEPMSRGCALKVVTTALTSAKIAGFLAADERGRTIFGIYQGALFGISLFLRYKIGPMGFVSTNGN